jgi:hypothetical protein
VLVVEAWTDAKAARIVNPRIMLAIITSTSVNPPVER